MAVKRKWEEREMRMLSEYLARFEPLGHWLTRVRLGEIAPAIKGVDLSPEEIAMFGVTRRWADAVGIYPDKVVIVEAAIRTHPGKISQLELYARLFKVTYEFREYWHLPLELWLLYAIEDPVLISMARDKGIRCTEYKPAWLPDYLALLMPRERRAPKPGMPLG